MWRSISGMQFQRIRGAKCWSLVAVFMKISAIMTLKVVFCLGKLVCIRTNNTPGESAWKWGGPSLWFCTQDCCMWSWTRLHDNALYCFQVETVTNLSFSICSWLQVHGQFWWMILSTICTGTICCCVALSVNISFCKLHKWYISAYCQ